MEPVTIITSRDQIIVGYVRDENWKTLIVTPADPDFCEYHIPKSSIMTINGREY